MAYLPPWNQYKGIAYGFSAVGKPVQYFSSQVTSFLKAMQVMSIMFSTQCWMNSMFKAMF